MTDATDLEDERDEAIEIARETMLGDMMKFIVGEMKALPRPWPEMSETQQDDHIERVRKHVTTLTDEALKLIASSDMPVVAATLESLTVKDGVKVVLTLPKGGTGWHVLMESTGQQVLIVSPDSFAGSDRGGPKPDPTQKRLAIDEGRPPEREVTTVNAAEQRRTDALELAGDLAEVIEDDRISGLEARSIDDVAKAAQIPLEALADDCGFADVDELRAHIEAKARVLKAIAAREKAQQVVDTAVAGGISTGKHELKDWSNFIIVVLGINTPWLEALAKPLGLKTYVDKAGVEQYDEESMVEFFDALLAERERERDVEAAAHAEHSGLGIEPLGDGRRPYAVKPKSGLTRGRSPMGCLAATPDDAWQLYCNNHPGYQARADFYVEECTERELRGPLGCVNPPAGWKARPADVVDETPPAPAKKRAAKKPMGKARGK